MNTVLTGLLIGALAAIAISSFIALFQFNSGAPWKELLKEWGMLIVLTVPAFASTTAAALLAWRYRRSLPKNLPAVGPVVAPGPASVVGLSLSEIVVMNAREQAGWHYVDGIEPTRRAFEEQGISQTVWNSGRHILTAAKIVKGSEWDQGNWAPIQRALDAIHAEPDRVWVRPLGERTMVCLHINETAMNKRYTRDPPTPQVDGLEY